MDGIEKIISKIEADAESTAAAIVSEAEAKRELILAEARERADAEAMEISSSAETEREKMLARAHSSGEHTMKKTLLARKVRIMDSVISRAVGNFNHSNPDEYFSAMKRLVERYALEGDQTMIFSDRDYGRLPAGFEAEVNSLAGKKGRITVSGGGGFDGGFLLVGEDVVENCTLAALVSEYDTEIRDELGTLLFLQ